MTPDLNALYAVGAAIGGALTGYLSARGTRTIQADAITALTSRIDAQQMLIETIPGLKEEIRVLTGLVTQKAPVEEVRAIVERIERKLDEALGQP